MIMSGDGKNHPAICDKESRTKTARESITLEQKFGVIHR
jgi:hypothetical protein